MPNLLLSMGHLLSSVLLAFSANVDNLAVGIAYGVKRIAIGTLSNLIIAIVSAAGTYASMSAGKLISAVLPLNVANWLGSILLIAIGIWTIWDTYRTKPTRQQDPSDLAYTTFIADPARADRDHSRIIDAKESIVLALALTLNNLGSGIGAGISGLDIPLTTLLTFIFSLLAVTIGYFLGARFTTTLSGQLTGIASGLLLIGLGIYEAVA